MLAHLLSGAWTIRRRFGALDFGQRQALVQAWSRRLLELMGVRLLVHGDLPADGPLVVLANHISWLDIIVIDAALPCRFVSKADVRHWPLIRQLVEGSGTLFIERDRRRDAMRVVHLMAERLQAATGSASFPRARPATAAACCPSMPTCCRPRSRPTRRCCRSACATPTRATAGATTSDLCRRHQPAGLLWSTLAASGLQAELHVCESDRAQGRDRRTCRGAAARAGAATRPAAARLSLLTRRVSSHFPFASRQDATSAHQPRRHVSTRETLFRCFQRDDGLWDIEGELRDYKQEKFSVRNGRSWQARRVHPPHADPRDHRPGHAGARDRRDDGSHPHGICRQAIDGMQRMVGCTMARGWRKAIDQHLGKVEGCTHLRELLFNMATAAFQALEDVRRASAAPDAPPAPPGHLQDLGCFRSGGRAGLSSVLAAPKARAAD